MTREQRLELLKQIEKDIYVCSIESTFLDDAKSCAIHSAIEELEQEPILDKIRAEIADIYCGQYCENPFTADAVREMALEIIDKYKEEQGVSG